MACRVLSEHKHLFSRSKGRARKESALDSTRRGNRKTAQEASEEATAYDANNLNQYTSIQEGTAEAFVPTFDADGNQTKVKTSTGIWNVVYNAENRPVTFTSADGATIVECTYDYMGRRHTRKITVNDNVTNHLRYIYRGYLQIAAINAVSGAFQWFILWDPTQPVATRPLGIRKDGTWYTYGWDLTKNICEVFVSGGTIGAAYTYTPYGAVTANGNVTQPIQWSSEYNDTELGLVYYNYRHYNPADGRWLGREPLGEYAEYNVYIYVRNQSINGFDVVGLFFDTIWDVGNMLWDVGTIVVGAATGDTEMMKEGAIDLAYDTAAAIIPGVPAGISKLAKTATKTGVKAAEKGASKKIAKKTRKDIHYGNCAPARHSVLNKAVGRACKGPKFSCPKQDPNCRFNCAKIATYIANALACISARTIINRECFNGGDKTHNDEIDRATIAVNKCKALSKLKGCL